MRADRSILQLLLILVSVLESLRSSAASNPTPGPYLIKTWETEDGLPENSATAIVQSSDGYLWFGTFNGLVRFDGVRFTVFDHTKVPELPSDGIVNLHLDKSGRFWVSSLAGLVVRDSAGWRGPFKSGAPAKDDYIRTFTERADGGLLLTTFHGKVLEFADETLRELPDPPGERGEGYQGSVDEAGSWWVVQHKFVGRWRDGRWESMIPKSDLANVMASRIAVARGHDRSIWLLVNSELVKYSHGSVASRRALREMPGNVWNMTEDSQGNIWICTSEQGVCQVLPGGDLVRWNEQSGMSYHAARFVFEDREKNLWMGTSGGGLQRFKLGRFQCYGPESGLSERVVKSVYPAASGGLWIATYGNGLFRWTEAGITNVPLPGWKDRKLRLQSVLDDGQGRTWVGTYELGLLLLDRNGCRQFPAQQMGGGNVVALFEDSRGFIWASGGHGVVRYENGEFRVVGNRKDAEGLANVCCFGETSDGVVWVSNIEKVFRLEKEGFDEQKTSDGGSIQGVICLKGDKDGCLWLGSVGEGLLRWKGGVLTKVGVESGLAVGSVHGIADDERGFFWLPSNRGIMRVRQQDLEAVANGTAARLFCQLLDRSDGLVSGECPSGNQPTFARDTTGRLWFATIKGVASIDPNLFRSNTVPPQVQIEEVVFRAGGKTTPGTGSSNRRLTPPFIEPLALPAGCRGVEIYYTAASFVSPEKVRFQIKLDDQEFPQTRERRMAYFDELEAGTHIFEVRAANDDGLWNQEGATLSLTVLPFFWETGLFRGLVAAGFCAGALFWVYRLKVRFEQKRVTQEAFTRQLILSQENERKRVAGELHDGLGQDLMLIKNRLGMLAGGASPDVARQLKEIGATTSRTIAEVRSISHALRPSALEQVGLSKAIEWMIEQLGEASSLKFSTELEKIDGILPPEMEINLYRIVQEALNNVLKHSEASEVIVGIKREPHRVLVTIFDNGKGFEVATSTNGEPRKDRFGLISMAERARVLGGHLEIQSTPGVGTRLTLQVDLSKNAL